MGGRKTVAAGMLRGAAGKALLCMVVAGLAVCAVEVAAKLLERRAPLVDLSARAPTTERRPEHLQNEDRLRFAIATMVSAEATFSTYRQLVRKVCESIDRREDFVVRTSYAEVRRALERGEVDVAFVCTGTYVHSLPEKKVKLLVQPEFVEGRRYRSLLIVPAGSRAQKLR